MLQNAKLIDQENESWVVWFFLRVLSINLSDVIIEFWYVRALFVLSKATAWIFKIILYWESRTYLLFEIDSKNHLPCEDTEAH